MNESLTSPSKARKIFSTICAVICILAGISLAFFRAWIWSGGNFGGEALGYAFSGIVIPALIAYAIAGRKKVRNLKRFVLGFTGVSVLIFVMELSSSHPREHTSVADLLREAAGTKSFVADDSNEIDRVARGVFSDLFARRKSHDAQMAKFESDLDHLYSASSFSDRSSMQRCIDAVQGAAVEDKAFFGDLRSWRDRVKQEVERSSLSEFDKKGFMKGFDESMASSQILNLFDRIVETEEKWASATASLYQFASVNVAKIRIQGSKIIIGDEKVRTQFNRDLEDSKRLNRDIETLNSQLAKLQQAGLNGMGVSRGDLGLGQSKPPSQ